MTFVTFGPPRPLRPELGGGGGEGKKGEEGTKDAYLRQPTLGTGDVESACGRGPRKLGRWLATTSPREVRCERRKWRGVSLPKARRLYTRRKARSRGGSAPPHAATLPLCPNASCTIDHRGNHSPSLSNNPFLSLSPLILFRFRSPSFLLAPLRCPGRYALMPPPLRSLHNLPFRRGLPLSSSIPPCYPFTGFCLRTYTRSHSGHEEARRRVGWKEAETEISGEGWTDGGG